MDTVGENGGETTGAWGGGGVCFNSEFLDGRSITRGTTGEGQEMWVFLFPRSLVPRARSEWGELWGLGGIVWVWVFFLLSLSFDYSLCIIVWEIRLGIFSHNSP